MCLDDGLGKVSKLRCRGDGHQVLRMCFYIFSVQLNYYKYTLSCSMGTLLPPWRQHRLTEQIDVNTFRSGMESEIGLNSVSLNTLGRVHSVRLKCIPTRATANSCREPRFA